MITMTEIAKLTNVSQPTVSRVLNGNKNVDPEIRERVLACAKEHNYQFNALAKSLQGGRTHLLGVILTNISNMFFTELSQQIETKARSLGYSIILFNTNRDPQKQLDYLDIVRQYRVDGLIIVPVTRDKKIWQECMDKIDIPSAVISKSVEDFDSFYLDHEKAAEEVAEYLFNKGYEKFLFIGNETDQKFRGFFNKLRELGVTGDNIKCCYCRSDADFKEFLSSEVDPDKRTGIFARNDFRAVQTIDTLRNLNITIPEQAGVFGFDNIEMGKYLRPRLSTVSQPTSEMVDQAVTRLVKRIETDEALDPIDIKYNATLIPRESS